MELNKIYNMDCLEGLKQLEDNSIGLIVTDPPYNTTNAEWEHNIDIKKYFEEFKRILKNKGVLIITSSEPFTCKLRHNNLDYFKYGAIWEKEQNSSPFLAKVQLGRLYEDISIFYNKAGKYNPQLIMGKNVKSRGSNKSELVANKYIKGENRNFKYPNNILKFNRDKDGFHPTQKPIALFKFLIKSYSNENDVVLDLFMGSGTTAVACKELGRNFIGFEISEEYCKIAEERLKKVNNKKLNEWFNNK